MEAAVARRNTGAPKGGLDWPGGSALVARQPPCGDRLLSDFYGSIFVPKRARNWRIQAASAGQAGAVTRLPSVMASFIFSST